MESNKDIHTLVKTINEGNEGCTMFFFSFVTVYAANLVLFVNTVIT